MLRRAVFLWLIAACFFLTVAAMADVPRLINVQGFLRDADGVPLDGNHPVTFSIWDQESGGDEPRWPGPTVDLDVSNGLYSATFGEDVDFFENLFNLYDELWLQFDVSGFDELPRMQMVSVPYAMHAATADGGGHYLTARNDTTKIVYVEKLTEGNARAHVHIGPFYGAKDGWYAHFSINGDQAASGVFWDGSLMSMKMGGPNTASGNYAMALGTEALAGSWCALAAGQYVSATAANSIVLGQGLDSFNHLINSTPGSMIVGFNTDTPTLFVGGEHHRVGVGTDQPREMLTVTGTADVGGFRMEPGAQAGYVLTSDAGGHAQWQPPGTGFSLPYSGIFDGYGVPLFGLQNTGTTGVYYGEADNDEPVLAMLQRGTGLAADFTGFLDEVNTRCLVSVARNDTVVGVQTHVSGLGGGAQSNFGGYFEAIGGQNNYGLFGRAFSQNPTEGEFYGLYGYAGAFGGTHYGVYGVAEGYGTNWAGYFDGRVQVNGEVHLTGTGPFASLRFPDATGDKIYLFDGIAGKYGLGIQGSLLQIFADHNGSDIAFGYGTSASFTEKMRIKGDGKVGIGTPTPGSILAVGQGLGPVLADAFTPYSSRRWKTNIRPLEGAIETVKRLRGVSYDWKKDGRHDIGLIAEEVGEVLPEVVAYEENGIDAKAVDYARIVAVLIEAVKEQQREIDALKAEVAAVSSRKPERVVRASYTGSD